MSFARRFSVFNIVNARFGQEVALEWARPVRLAFHCGARSPEVPPDPLVSFGDSSRLVFALVLALGALIFHCEARLVLYRGVSLLDSSKGWLFSCFHLYWFTISSGSGAWPNDEESLCSTARTADLMLLRVDDSVGSPRFYWL